MQDRCLAEEAAGRGERRDAGPDDPHHPARGQVDEDRGHPQPLVLCKHGLGLARRCAALVEWRTELAVAEAGAQHQEVVVLGPALPQTGARVGRPADDLRGIGEGEAQVGDYLGSAPAHVRAEARELLGVLPARAAGGFAGLAAALPPVADHQHRAEEAEEGEEDVV